jgi:phage terminase large subunit-like protein
MKIVLTTNNVFENISVIQGELRYQQGTSDGYALSSINFPKQDDGIIDQYYCNIYVNGKKWKNVDSILDMAYEEEACVIKTGQSGGIDVFFGSGSNGKIPPMGATILLEYIASQGEAGNIDDINESSDSYWRFESGGYLPNGEIIDLNEVLSINTQNQFLFGCDEESISLTKLIAPHTSRSFVLATAENYKYFLRRLNIFSIIDAIQGFNTYDDIKAKYEYNNAYSQLTVLNNDYYQAKELYGSSSAKTMELYDKIISQKKDCEYWKNIYEQTKLDDNTVYLFLVPNIIKRIGETNNYFTCSKEAFNLTNDEKYAIKDLIAKSGQQMITTEVEIISPKIANFAINCFIQMWEGYEFDSVKSNIINNVSNYLINNNRRDRIPISDLIKTVEEIDGVDSVTIMFEADKKNENIYGNGNYGIDEFGDIIISRYLRDENGNKIEVKDILPMFRGGFTSFNGVEYGEDIYEGIGPINISLRGISYK